MSDSILAKILGLGRSQKYNLQHSWPEGMQLQFPRDPKYLTLVFFDESSYKKTELSSWREVSSNSLEKGYNLINFRAACEIMTTRCLKYICPGSAETSLSFDEFRGSARAVFGRRLPTAVIIQYQDNGFVYYDFSQSGARYILPDIQKLISELPLLDRPGEDLVMHYGEVLDQVLEINECYLPDYVEDKKDDVQRECPAVRFRVRPGNEYVGRDTISTEVSKEKTADKNKALIKKFFSIYKQLRDAGITDEYIQSVLKYEFKASRLRVTAQGRLFLVDYNNVEVKMDPLSKAVYLLYLKHPEGIHFKDLIVYSDELFHLYSKVSNRSNLGDMRESVGRLVDPKDNSINEKTSKANRAFNAIMGESAARLYYIDGVKGEDKSVSIDRDLVIWEL